MSLILAPTLDGKCPLKKDGSAINLTVKIGGASLMDGTYKIRKNLSSPPVSTGTILDGTTILLGADTNLTGMKIYMLVSSTSINGLDTSITVEILGGKNNFQISNTIKDISVGDTVVFKVDVRFI
jgi:hypothetical protein